MVDRFRHLPCTHTVVPRSTQLSTFNGTLKLFCVGHQKWVPVILIINLPGKTGLQNYKLRVKCDATLCWFTYDWAALALNVVTVLCWTVAFKIYDIDRDGYISNGELFHVLKMMVGANLKDAQLQQIVDKTIINADTDGDGKISFEEFCMVWSHILA